MMVKKLVILSLFMVSLLSQAQQLAFPGAEGFGRFATGGRSGSVYHVTNLNDSGAGSFRDAVSQSNRIVVFDVGGVIHLESVVVVNRNITIAGQTAPGQGITLYGNRLAFNGNSGNNIVRYIRVRLGAYSGGKDDAMSISDDKDTYMFDHVSVSWGRDGTFDINSNSDNITLQDCIIGQGINKDNHSTGGLIQCGPISIIRTLWIDNKTRNPKIRFKHEYINSVIYNWSSDGYIMGATDGADTPCNVLGNYFIAGPSSSISGYITRTTARTLLYPEDNWLDDDKDGSLNGRELVAANGDYKTANIMSTAFDYPGVNTLLSAQDAVAHIIENAGSSLARDAVDELLINQLKSYGTKGAIISIEDDNGIPGNVGVVENGQKPLDSDNDGMPDEWEDANGLNKNSDDAMVIAANGYANIENYINSINSAFSFLKAPANIRATAKTTNSVTLSWTLDEDKATQVIIEYSSDNSFSNTKTVDAGTTSALIEGLESYTDYNFRFKSTDGDIESGSTNVFSIKTSAEVIPPKTSFNPTPEDGTTLSINKFIDFSWDNKTGPGAGVMYYDFILGESENDMDTLARDLTALSYNLSELEPNTTYFWRIRAKNLLGSDPGEIWSFTTGAQIVRNKVLYIPFDELSGTIAENVAGPNNATAKNITPQWLAGKLNNSIYLNPAQTETGMVVNHYEDLYFDNTSFTISFWMKSDVDANGGDIYVLHKGTHNKDNGGTGKWIGIQLKKGERFTFGIDDNSTKTVIDLTDNPNQYFNDEWHFITFIRDIEQGQLRVYVDGTLVKSTTDNTGNIAETAALAIGNNNTAYDTPFNGSLDGLTIYDEVLLDAEIEELYNNPTNPIRSIKAGTKSLEVYPIPFIDKLTIKNPEPEVKNITISIFDLSGQLVYSEKANQAGSVIAINGLNKLPGGMYTCRISGTKHVYVQKVIKL